MASEPTLTPPMVSAPEFVHVAPAPDTVTAPLEFAKAPTLVRTTTGVGAVELRVPGSTAYAVDVHTGAGASSVKVDQDPSSTHRIEVRTEVGAVKIEPLP